MARSERRSPAIAGIGMTKFGRHLDLTLKQLAGPAIAQALSDAGMSTDDIDMAFVANSMSAVITGQAAVVGQSVLRAAGFAGIPVFNIDNACAGSSSALSLAAQAIRSGSAEAVLVVGVEKLYSTDRAKTYTALNGAADLEGIDLTGVDLTKESVFVKAAYPPRIRAYTQKYRLAAETLAAIAVKNRSNAGLNPLAQYTAPVTPEDVLASRMVVEPITALMCAPISDGATAVVLTSADRASDGRHQPVWLRACEVGMAGADGAESSTIARISQRAYRTAGLGPADIHLAEVHDSIAFNELLAYEELGFCGPGEATELVNRGRTLLGGDIPVNTSGGLESRGHPIAATGLAQIIELVIQLRGEAGGRQVQDARHALAENAGGYAGGDTAAIAVSILSTD